MQINPLILYTDLSPSNKTISLRDVLFFIYHNYPRLIRMKINRFAFSVDCKIAAKLSDYCFWKGSLYFFYSCLFSEKISWKQYLSLKFYFFLKPLVIKLSIYSEYFINAISIAINKIKLSLIYLILLNSMATNFIYCY